MRKGLQPVVVIACSALLLAGGCGSSGYGSSSTAATTSSTSSTSTSGGLKADTTPKYAAPSSSSPVQSGVVQVAYRNIAIDPDTLRVKVGGTIKWTNYDSVEHNVTSRGGVATFASKNFGEGGTYEIKATKPGIIHYLCTIHPTSMNGTIEVVK
jgi:plastocyanin